MRSRWEIWTSTARGKRIHIATGNTGSFELAYGLNMIGNWEIELEQDFDLDLVPLDNLVEFWRAPENGRLSIVRIGFIKERTLPSRRKYIAGPDHNDILQTRIIAYNAGTTDTAITGNYDDTMKHIIRSNFGSLATDTDRDLSAYNLTVSPDLSAAPSGTMAFARKDVYKTLVKLADASREAGTELYFDLVPVIQSDQSIGFDFRTYINQPGQDRTEGNDNPVQFGEKWGNLRNPLYIEDARQEINDVYAGGVGKEESRIIEQASNSVRISRSPWNRREGFADYSNVTSTDTLYSIAQAEIAANRPRYIFSGDLIDTPKARFQKDWDLGYRVTCDHADLQFDALVRYVEVIVAGNREVVKASVEVEA